MAGTISMSGLGSGMDVDGIVTALVNAAKIPETVLKNRLTLTKSASTSISDISSLLSKLKTSVDALSTPEKAQSYSATSSDTAISASITTATSAARYSVDVEALAQEYRAYSTKFTKLSDPLVSSATDMTIQVGSNAAVNIGITSEDTLDSLVTKINSASLGVTASTLYDGSGYRLQLRGVDGGDNNRVTVSGTDLGLNVVGNFKQQAQDAHLLVDGFDVYSHTNVITGAIPGVSLTVSAVTDGAKDVTVNSDSASIKTKVDSFVSAYNAVISKVHSTAGYGSVAAGVEILAGNSTLRSLTTSMSNTLRTVMDSGDSTYSTLNSLGISTASDGSLTLDNTKFSKAISANPDAVTKIFAGTTARDGVMDLMSTMVKSFTNSSNGLLTNQLATFKANTTRLNSRVDAFEARMVKYEERLRAQFDNMDSIVSAANATSSYLSSIGS